MDAADLTTGYGPPTLHARTSRGPHRSRADLVLRGVLSLVVLAAALLGAAVLAFVALVVWEGCFISCASRDPQPGVGLLWGVGALLALAAGAWAVRRVWRMRSATVRAWAWLLGGAVVAYLVFAAVATGLQAWADAGCPDTGRLGEGYSFPDCPVPPAGWLVAWTAAAVPVVAAGRRAHRVRQADGRSRR